MRSRLRLALGWLSIWALPCSAIAPATEQQIVCARDYIVEATVLSASRACTESDGKRTCVGGDETLLLDLRIDRVVAQKDRLQFAAGGTEQELVGSVRTGYVGSMPLSAADEAEGQQIFLALIRESSARANRPEADPTDRLRESLDTSRAARSRFVESRMRDHLVGDRFVFALNFSTVRPRSFDGQGWGIDQEPRVVSLLREADGRRCAKLRDAGSLHDAGSPDVH